MKVIIAGSRSITYYGIVRSAVVLSGMQIDEVVSGEWDSLGRRAGFVRNAQMAHYADASIAVTNGSHGTADMISQARDHNLKIYVLYVS